MQKYLVTIICLLIFPLSTFAAVNTTKPETTKIIRPSVRIFNPLTGELKKDFFPFPDTSGVLGLSIAAADLNNDNLGEIVIGAGSNEKPLVKIFDSNGQWLREFLAYEENYTGGVRVIVADLYHANNMEILVSQLETGSSQIKIFTATGKPIFNFYAFDQAITGGVNLAAADVNNDGQTEIIVGAGYEQESVIKIFDNYGNFIKSFPVFDKNYKNGVNVLAVDFNNDQKAEILVAPNTGYAPEIRAFDYDGNLIRLFYAYDPGFGGGVNLAAADIDNDHVTDLITGAGFSGGAHVRFFDLTGKNKINPKFFTYPDFKGGLSVSAFDINNDQRTELLVATQTISPLNQYGNYKQITIDLSKQHLYALFKGAAIKDFIISTGKWKFPTPVGSYKILTKLPKTNMARYYGPDNPDNYDLPNVPSVMYFYRDYAIHGAYWHWKFGTRVSHGCVNLKLSDAKWLYDWSKVGTQVKIY